MLVKPKKPAGRPPVPHDKELVQRSIRMTRPQWAKIDAAGGVEALRKLVDRWRPPTK